MGGGGGSAGAGSSVLYLLGVCSGCTEGEAELSQALTAAVDHLPAGSTAGKCALKKKMAASFLLTSPTPGGQALGSY